MTNGPKDRILLIGFRGCGKSTVGRKLATELGWEYVSTDHRVEEKAAMAISEIVEKRGWKYFRKLEGEVIGELPTLRNSVIDAGGGVVIEHRKEIETLINSSVVVWIDAHLEDIIRRLKGDKDRPLLNQKNLVEDVEFNYEKRCLIYQKLAIHTFNTSLESVAEICNQIILEMGQK
jgi:shikimate kinase